MKSLLKNCLILFTLISCTIASAQSGEIDSLNRVLKVVKADTAKVNIYNKISDKFRESNPDSTNYYARVANTMSAKLKYGLGLANSNINLGNSNIIKGQYSKALSHFKIAQQEFRELVKQDPKNIYYKNGLARAYASSGVVYSEQSNYHASLDNYLKALKLWEETGAKNNISKAYNNIAILYKSLANNKKALEYLTKAYKIQEETGEQAAAVTLTNIGVLHFESNDQEKAISYYKQAEKLFKKIDNKRGFALLNNYLGDYHKKQNDTQLALTYYQTSLTLSEELQNKFGASLSLYKIGQLLLDQRKYQEALPIATKSLTYAKEIGVLDQRYHSEKLVSELYGLLNNPEQSLLHFKEYIKARDSIINQENNKKFALAEMNAEFQKKEALLIEKNKRQTQLIIFIILGTLLVLGLILLTYNRLQVKRRLTLQKEVAEYEQKALHLQMNPHFVFNCLSAISSFIVQNGTDSALKYLSKFSKLMRLTLEYSKGSLIPIDKEIESLQNYLELEQLRFHNIFEFTISSSSSVEFNMGLPPLLIQPFVENAILHGVVPKESDGKIDVHFDVADSQLICIITDNGIGIERSVEAKEFSVTAHRSMALEITKKRLQIMESMTSKSAQIEIKEIQNESQTGTMVTLRLPIQYIS